MKSTVAKPATNRKALNGLRGSLVLRNRQWVRQVNLRYLRRIVQWFLQHELVTRQFELGIHLVGTSAITRLNRVYLGHYL
jgi:ssRNA-specific RNase YbeY (16S rRNA maturation enzyme)